MENERQPHPTQQAQAGGARQRFQAAIHLRKLMAGGVFVQWHVLQQRFHMLEKPRGNAVRCSHFPAAMFLAQRDQPCLPCQHFHRKAQNLRQQFVQVEFLGEGTGDLKQRIALVDTEVGEHRKSKSGHQGIRASGHQGTGISQALMPGKGNGG